MRRAASRTAGRTSPAGRASTIATPASEMTMMAARLASRLVMTMLTASSGQHQQRCDGVAPIVQPGEADGGHQNRQHRDGDQPDDRQVDDAGGVAGEDVRQDRAEGIDRDVERLPLERTPGRCRSRAAPRRAEPPRQEQPHRVGERRESFVAPDQRRHAFDRRFGRRDMAVRSSSCHGIGMRNVCTRRSDAQVEEDQREEKRQPLRPQPPGQTRAEWPPGKTPISAGTTRVGSILPRE